MTPRGFTRCDECGPLGRFHDEMNPCPSCSGSGLVPTEKLREDVEILLAIDAVQGPPRRIGEKADAVLRKVAEHIREER